MTNPLLHSAAIFSAVVFSATPLLRAQQSQPQQSAATSSSTAEKDAAAAASPASSPVAKPKFAPPAPVLSPAPSPAPNAAQEVPLPTGQTPAGGSAIDQPISLIPENVPSISKPSSSGPGGGGATPQNGPPVQTSKTIASEQDLKARVHFREIKTLALSDPAVQEQWDRAQHAPTDPAHREAMRQYYKLLFERMKKIDPSLAARADWMESYDIGRLAQPYFDPKVEPKINAKPKPPVAPAAAARSPAVIGGGTGSSRE